MPYLYSTKYAWPFPSLPVVMHPVEGTSASPALPALLDTGADGTLVPAAHLKAIQADEIYATRLRSHWGESRPVTVCLVDLEVAGYRLPGIEVVADERGKDVLLGRNVLNKLILLLNGPDGETDVLSRRPARV